MFRYLLCFMLGLSLVFIPVQISRAQMVPNPSQPAEANDALQAEANDALQAAAQAYLAKTAELGQQGIQVAGGTVSGAYALLTWEDGLYGAGGGQVLMINESGVWRVVRGSGGAVTYQMLINYGVPAEDARQLGGL
jgi:hypothetical protein